MHLCFVANCIRTNFHVVSPNNKLNVGTFPSILHKERKSSLLWKLGLLINLFEFPLLGDTKKALSSLQNTTRQYCCTSLWNNRSKVHRLYRSLHCLRSVCNLNFLIYIPFSSLIIVYVITLVSWWQHCYTVWTSKLY